MTAEEFEGYVAGDVTYCIDPASDTFFPVRVTRVEPGFVDVESIDLELTQIVSTEFEAHGKNRRFLRPDLPPHARFGGHDERIVNAERETGKELRLLPYHYATNCGGKIQELHRENPATWPLPTGIVYDRWFKDADL